MARTASLLFLVLLTVTAGCIGGTGTTTPTNATGATKTAQGANQDGGATPTDGGERAGAAGGADHQTKAPQRIGAYDSLYNQTIDSVVKLKVVTAQGATSVGSGFVYDTRGRVVTNQHVVENAATVMVRFRDGTWRVGEVVGSDVYTDLAVVDVDNVSGIEPLPVAERNVEPGDPVVALGSPFGLEGTITHGMVSGVNRSMPTSLGFSIPDTIQTDAPINPGNSGGPLVSLEGKVVGVNRATRGDNVGFAISADVLQRVVPRLIENGSFAYPYLGVRTKTVTPVIASASDLSSVTGVMVTRHLPDSPARGTLQAASERYTRSGRAVPVNGDVIVEVDGRAIHTKQELSRYLLLHTRPGESVEVTVLRDGARKTVTIDLGSRPEFPRQARNGTAEGDRSSG